MSRKHYFLRLILILSLLFLAACSSSRNESNSGHDKASPEATPPEIVQTQDAFSQRLTNSERKVIYEALLSILVNDIDKAVDDLNNKALIIGGYVANSSRNSSDDHPSASVTYRIPQDNYLDFLVYARDLGEIENEYIDSKDVTEEFVDLEARLLSYRTHEERLLAMYELGQNIDELLALERELARVRENIETIEGRLRYFEENIEMTLVTINLYKGSGVTEIPGIKPVGFKETLRRALKAIVNSLTFLLNILSYGLVALAASLPFLIPALALIILFFHLRRKRKKTDTTP